MLGLSLSLSTYIGIVTSIYTVRTRTGIIYIVYTTAWLMVKCPPPGSVWKLWLCSWNPLKCLNFLGAKKKQIFKCRPLVILWLVLKVVACMANFDLIYHPAELLTFPWLSTETDVYRSDESFVWAPIVVIELKSSPLVGSPATSKLYMLTRGERYWQAPTVVCVCVCVSRHHGDARYCVCVCVCVGYTILTNRFTPTR